MIFDAARTMRYRWYDTIALTRQMIETSMRDMNVMFQEAHKLPQNRYEHYA